MAQQSLVDVCNLACSKVGAAGIASLADDSREARACAKAYDRLRRDELRRHVWCFAIKRVALAPDTASPAFDFAYQFTIPSDCLRVILPPEPACDWVLDGRKILSNAGPVLKLRYVADITDCTQWGPSYYSALAVSISIDICEALTQSNQKKQMLMSQYKEAIVEARKADALEKLPADATPDSWLIAHAA